MTAGNIQNSKRISLYGSKQTHGIDWQNHFFLFSHLKQFRNNTKAILNHSTQQTKKGQSTLHFHRISQNLDGIRYTFLNPCVHTKEKKKTLKQQYQFLFPGCGGGNILASVQTKLCISEN